MKKSLPAVLVTLALCAFLPTTNVFANNGGDNRPTLRPHQALNSSQSQNSQAGHGGNWFTNLWDSIRDFFGHHHDSGSGGATSGGATSGGAGSPAPSGPSGAPAAPIDGGLSLLLVAGAGLGVKKMRDNYKNKKND